MPGYILMDRTTTVCVVWWLVPII